MSIPSFLLCREKKLHIEKVKYPPIPGIMEIVLLLSQKEEPHLGVGAVWGRKPSSASIHCVWETYLRFPASHGCEIMAIVYVAKGEGAGKGFFALVPVSSAHISTSWDCIWTECEPCSL